VSDPRTAPARLTVGVVGAGRCGAVLGAALARAGHHVVGVSAVSDASVRRAQRLLPGIPIRPVARVAEVCDLLLLAVPDDTLASLVAGLAATGSFHPGQIVVHTHPAEGIGILEPACAHDILPLAIHPALALAGEPSDVGRLREAVFAVTTLQSLRPLGEALVIEMGGEPVWVQEEDRPGYAAALAAVREGLQGVVTAAARLLQECGIPRPARVLGPLAISALEQALAAGSVAATRANGAPDDEEP
jgi:predicted short-subunit dehydrogenase-like oxidoreductase (DUF2520 family)